MFTSGLQVFGFTWSLFGEGEDEEFHFILLTLYHLIYYGTHDDDGNSA